MGKTIYHDWAARGLLANGVDALTHTVQGTLGPDGRSVVLFDHSGHPVVTNDGSTVAGLMTFREPSLELCARLLKEAPVPNGEDVGHGSTTASVLVQSILREGQKNLAAGADPIGIRAGIQQAVAEAEKALETQSHPITSVEQIRSLGLISSGEEETGELLAQAMKHFDREGVITVEPSSTSESFVEFSEGLRFEQGWFSSGMLQPDEQEKGQVELEDAYILTADQNINSLPELLPLLQQLIGKGGKMVIVATGVSDDVLAALAVNRLRGQLNVICVKAPGVGEQKSEMLGDIAAVTGGQVFSPKTGFSLRTANLDFLGRAKSVKITAHATMLMEGVGTERNIRLRISQIHALLDATDDDIRRRQLMERLSKLGGGVAIIKVGAVTEMELTEKRLRTERALNSARAAVLYGVVAGGGAAYVHAIPAVEALRDRLTGDEALGAAILARAMGAPLRQIMCNAGLNGNLIYQRVREQTDPAFGFDVRRGEYGSLLDRNIIDPVREVRAALRRAASIAASILTTEAVVMDPPVKDSDKPKGGHFSIYD